MQTVPRIAKLEIQTDVRLIYYIGFYTIESNIVSQLKIG